MLRQRPHRHSPAGDKAILISDRGHFIADTRLLLGPDEVRTLLMATTVDDAIRLISSENCYCVLVDDALACGMGVQAVTRLRTELGWPELAIPVILLAERTTMATIRKAVRAGVDEVLSTPLSHRTLTGRMLAARLRPRPFVSTAGYDGPCRRRLSEASLVGNELRRADDLAPRQVRRLARDVHGHLIAYQATQRAAQMLCPTLLNCGLEDLTSATADLYEATLPLQDARISGLALMGQTIAACHDRVREDPALLLAILRDLLTLLEIRLQKAATRLESKSRKSVSDHSGTRSIATHHSD